LCICVLCSPVNAATRQNVTIPSNTDITAPGRAVASRSGDALRVGVQEGEYIEAARLNKKLPVKVLKTVDYSIPRTITQAKGILKTNLGQIVIGGVISGAVAAVGWVMSDENTKPKLKKKISEGAPVPVDQYGWVAGNYCSGRKFASVSEVASCGVKALQSVVSPAYIAKIDSISGANTDFQTIYLGLTYTPDGSYRINGSVTAQRQGQCKAPGRVVGDQCVTGEPTYEDVTPADIDQKFDSYAATQNGEWLKSLLRETCQGSGSLESCMQSLRVNTSTSGPSSVTADKTVSTGTYTKPDGTIGTTKTETTTNYNIKYGPTYFDFSEHKTTITYKDDAKVGEETTTETDDVTDEKPAEEDKEDSAPCSTGCDGPAYTDLYKPTEKTKEKELDSYSSRVQQIPLMKAVVGLFNVNAPGGQCPIWQIHNQLDILGTTLPLDLVFDQHCLPWFQDKKYFIQAIVLIGFAYVSIRIGLL
jgi:hypothetical protein